MGVSLFEGTPFLGLLEKETNKTPILGVPNVTTRPPSKGNPPIQGLPKALWLLRPLGGFFAVVVWASKSSDERTRQT